MDSEDHAVKKPSNLIDKLFQEGYRFNFFEAVYILERLYKDSAPPGEEGPLSREAIRFRASPEMSFPATTVRRIEKKTDQRTQMVTERTEIVQMALSFMGLYGVNSPLPPYFSQIIVPLGEDESEEEDEDEARILRMFLDTLDHRIYSLFYRSWKKYRYYLQFEEGAKDRFSHYMLSLFGLGTPALRDLVGVASDRLISYSGALGQKTRCAASLENMLSSYFGGIPVKIMEFMPRWVNFPRESQPRLGTGHNGVKARLSENVTIGERVRDLNSKFRIALGPLSLEVFRRFLPGETDFQDLYHLVRFYSPGQLLFDLELLIRKEEAPPLQLGSESEQLGLTSWLDKPVESVTSVVFSFGEGLMRDGQYPAPHMDPQQPNIRTS